MTRSPWGRHERRLLTPLLFGIFVPGLVFAQTAPPTDPALPPPPGQQAPRDAAPTPPEGATEEPSASPPAAPPAAADEAPEGAVPWTSPPAARGLVEGSATAPAAPQANAPLPPPPPPPPAEKKEHFFDRIDVRGYTQFRYNHLGQTNPDLVNIQGDRSMGGDGGGFFFRRARIILYGKLHEQVQVYLQPDFVSAPSGDSLHFTQLRDWYADISDPSTEFRIRVGQSKVPFGFENMQSSSNRLPLDRSDPINSAVANERDIGLFFYYAPVEVRRRFKELTDSGLKGSGDYGMAGIGVYNGQTANRPELNENKHVVARLTYPFLFGEQYLEVGAAGYAGKFVVQKDAGIEGPEEFRDARVHAHFVLYPQPFGLQVEYNAGIGPELDAPTVLPPEGTPYTGVVRERGLHGGYAMAMFKVGDFIPYTRVMYYEGGKKHEKNAPRYDIREIEMGVEWSIVKALELTGAYTIAERTFGAPPYNQEQGRLFRFQLQINY